jgi:methyltransferase (TIGR00027 family)
VLPGQASQTLLITSIMRARHQLFDAPVILEDPVVLNLVPEAHDPEVLSEFGDSSQPIPILLRSLFAMRSRFTEDRLAQAAARGIRQYVMFGAGLDTFPWRQPDFARDMQIFAIDHPASFMQTNKVFQERGFAKPTNLVRVPLDLEQRRLGECLVACGFDLEVGSFCSALGLMQYLEDEIADDIFRFVTSLAPSSEIVFTFILPDNELTGVDLELARRVAARTAELGEQWKSRLQPPAMVDRLTRIGFREVFHLSPELAQERYFAGRSDKLRAPRFEQLISAMV